MTTRTRAAGLLSAIIMTAGLAACSSSGSDDGGSTADAGSSSFGSEDSTSSEPGAGSSDDAGTSGSPGSTGRDLVEADDGTTSSSAGGPSTPQMDRAVVSSGTVSLSSKDVLETRQEVQRIVDAQGGDITEENTRTDEEGESSYSRFVIRVPSHRFGAAMSALEQIEGLVASNRGSDDVTTEVIDNAVRVRAQEASLKRVELLLAESKSLKDLIWIESQLTTRQAELDSLKSQQSWLTDQSSLSTITVDISQKEVEAVAQEEPRKKDDEPAGFLDGLSGGMKALGGTFTAIGLIVGALLPFALVALVIAVPVWIVVRRRRGGRPLPAPAETP